MFEISKSFLLRQQLAISQVNAIAGIPKALLDEEKRLNEQISDYQIKINNLTNGFSAAQDSMLEYKNKLSGFEIDRQLLLTKFSSVFPAYFNAQYKDSVVSIETLQKQTLDSNQALLEYFIADSSIFVFLVQPDTFQSFVLRKPPNLSTQIDSLLKSINAYAKIGLPAQEYQHNKILYFQNAYQIYQDIFAPVHKHIGPSIKRLVIVPDEKLNQVPFDALLTNLPNPNSGFKSFDYLLHKFAFSIAPSATVLHEMILKTHNNPPSKSYLGVAPVFPNDTLAKKNTEQEDFKKIIIRNSKAPLDYNDDEVKAAQEAIGGDVKIGKAATKTAFTKNASDYQLLHLSTHGLLDNNNSNFSALAFTNNNDKETNDYAKKYYNRVSWHLKESMNKLRVVEFVEKGSLQEPNTHLDGYQLAHVKIFRKIRQLFNQKDEFKYTRILSFLPNNETQNDNRKMAWALLNCSVQTFSHVYRSLLWLRKDFTLCVAPIKRLINYALIEYDNEEPIIISENYKYYRDIIVPDVLFINQCSKYGGEINKLFTIYRDDMTEMSNIKDLQITLANFEHLMKIAQGLAEKSAIKHENEMMIARMYRTREEAKRDSPIRKSFNKKLEQKKIIEKAYQKFIDRRKA